MKSVECEQCRDELSARLDGEEDLAIGPAVDAHVAACVECREWSHNAAAVTRRARISAVTPSAGLAAIETVLAAAPGPHRRRWASTLRIALGVLGFAQFTLGMAQINVFSSAGHDHSAAGTSSAHLWHESAAWNVALGAGFAWIAARRTRPAGLVPLLTAFVGLLVLLSANDLWRGQVDSTRILSHGLLIIGYLIVLALTRPALEFGDPPPGRLKSTDRWRARFDEDDAFGTPTPLRLVTRQTPQASAGHDRAA